ncbi:MAG: 4-hydroxythreonine-4-phosphate dehydrogenase PdxA [Devosia sp.]|nr:4-hydroxythreonine-4-phosphate dehydrogenase PdxA [Devosia sp.]
MTGYLSPPLAVSMGEPAGIGPDLILKLFADRSASGLPAFAVFGHAPFLRQRAARLGLTVDIAAVEPADAPAVFATALPVVDLPGLVPDRPGEATPVSAPVVIAAIAEAVKATLTGTCRGLVTAPIHKAALYSTGFSYPGHTEYLAALCANGREPRLPVMMLAHEDLRVVPLTIHVPLARVPELATADLLVKTVQIVAHDLKTRFGIGEPRLAVAGLNPHAGENGGIGMEELDRFGPAVAKLVAEGFKVEGPLPADTLFYPPHWRNYDAVIAMYHDQALIPIKTVAFEQAVNVTLGLQIVRTSPDHGTALALAGTGKASAASLLAAIRLADRLTANHGA